MKIDYDKFGYCCMCHKSLTKIIVSDGKPSTVFTADVTHMEVVLDDGSKMRVITCKTCKEDYRPHKDSKRLMTSVIKGWEKECDELVADTSKPQFDEKWKEEHMKVYSKREIV